MGIFDRIMPKKLKKIQIMSYYFIAQIRIKDEYEYQKYIDKAGDIFNKYKGKYLSIDNNPLILEGDWNYTRAVLIKFNSKNDFNDWYNSTDYQRILKHRLNAAHCDTILVQGLD
jgi:uncharacterized protein (DUF1330 family)